MGENHGPRHPQHYGRSAVLLLLVLAAGPPAVACRQTERPAEVQAARPVLRVGTAFAPFSTRLTEEYRRTLPDVDIQEQQIPSSGATLRALQEGTLDFGVALADDAYRAYTGGNGAPTPDSQVRGISLLQPLPMYLLVRPGSGIHGVADLKGRIVGVGPRNTSSWTLGHLILKAFKIDPASILVLAGPPSRERIRA